MLSCGAIFVLSAVLFFVTPIVGSVEILMIARLVNGLASGLTTSTLPMYLTELAPLELRGTLGALTQMGLVGGIIFGQVGSLQHVFGTPELWHIAFSAYAVLVVVFLLPFHWFSESPKYLYIVKKDEVRAKKGEYLFNIYYKFV